MSILDTIQRMHNEREATQQRGEEVSEQIKDAQKSYCNKQMELGDLKEELNRLISEYAQTLSTSHANKQQHKQQMMNEFDNMSGLYRKTLSGTLNAAQHKLDCIRFEMINSIRSMDERWKQQNTEQMEAIRQKEQIKQKLLQQLENQRKMNTKTEEMLKQHQNRCTQMMDTNKSKHELLHRLQIEQEQVLNPQEMEVNSMKSAMLSSSTFIDVAFLVHVAVFSFKELH
eukprot:339131_1